MKLFYSEEQILNYANTDKYFIDYSPKDLEKNLHHLAQLHYFGNHLGKNLDEKLKYRKEHKELNHFKYKEFIGSIRLYSLIIKGQTIENYHYRGNENDFEKDYVLFKNELIDNLEKLYLPNYSLGKFIKSYLESDEIEYLKQSMFFKIDFEKIPYKDLSQSNEQEQNEEKMVYNHVLMLFDEFIKSDYYKNGFYPTIQHGSSQCREDLILRYFPRSEHEQFDNNKTIVRKRLISFFIELLRIIYFGKDKFLPVFYVRVNLHNHQNEVAEFQKKNQIAILVDQPSEKEYWDYLENKNKKLKLKYVQFIGRWFDLQNKINETDVIIVSQYLKSSDKKIGLIRKGTKFFERGGNKEFKIFELENVKNIENKDISIFNSIIPQSATLSPVKQRLDFLHYKLFQRPSGLKLSLDNISPNLIELICLEWLRSNLCDENLKIKYQLLKFGGNYADVDIFGKTFSGKTIACQVTYSKDIKTIKSKIEKITDFESQIKIVFCNGKIEDESVTIIPLIKVWNDLHDNKDYLEFLKFLSLK